MQVLEERTYKITIPIEQFDRILRGEGPRFKPDTGFKLSFVICESQVVTLLYRSVEVKTIDIGE